MSRPSRPAARAWTPRCLAPMGLAPIAGLLLCLLGGCSVGPDFKPPTLFSPASWFASRPKPVQPLSVTVAEPIDPAWF